MARRIAAVLALLAASAAWPAASFSQECGSMGQTCGDDTLCSGMGSHCGDRSECSGSDSTCGANSVCSGMSSKCGPGSQCTGLGAQCASGGAAGAKGSQWQSSDDDDSMSWKPMKWKPMKWKPMKETPVAHVYVHGCDQGDVCSSRPGAAQSNGVSVCCKDGCQDCSASTSQSSDILTATCVCKDPPPAARAQAPQPRAPNGVKVKATGCEMGDVCQSRPGAAQADGLSFCCPARCGTCEVRGAESNGMLTAMCMCDGQMALAEEAEAPADAEPEKVSPVVAVCLAGFVGTALVLAAFVGATGGSRSETRQPLLTA